MRIIANIAIAFCVLFLSGCTARSAVYSDAVEDLDYGQYNTYAWLPVIDTASNSLYHNEVVEQNLVQAIDGEMQARGYSLDAENPDLLVLLHLQITKEEETIVDPQPLGSTYSYYYPGYRPAAWRPYYYPAYNTITHISGPEIRELQYTQGTVVVDVIRQNDKQLIWRGWSSETIQPQNASAELTTTVEQIFTEYPVTEEGAQ